MKQWKCLVDQIISSRNKECSTTISLNSAQRLDKSVRVIRDTITLRSIVLHIGDNTLSSLWSVILRSHNATMNNRPSTHHGDKDFIAFLNRLTSKRGVLFFQWCI